MTAVIERAHHQSHLPNDGTTITYWDCNTFIGRPSGRRNTGGRLQQPEGLLAEMDRVGVSGGMVYHILAHEHAPAIGNAALIRDLAGEERLRPVWVVMPDHTGEMPAPSDLVMQMLAAGVRMARIFPSTAPSGHRFSLAEWCAGPLLSALEDVRLPLAIDFTLFRRGEPPWNDVYSICAHHPRLPVILMDVQGRNNRTLYPLLERFDNLYIQTAGFNVHHGVEDVVQRFGAGRLLFGSGYPVQSLGGARLHLERAQLNEDEKSAIGWGNLQRLLDEVDAERSAQ